MRWLLAILLTIPCLAANRYVRDGGSGSGTSWSDAYDDLPAALTRGDTYYVADGLYAAYTADDAASSGSVITIKKAIASDHGTETGWSADYGDGQAIFTNNVNFSTSDYVFDGQTGGGPGAWNSYSGYGFAVWRGSGVTGVKNCTIGTSGAGATNVVIRHTDFAWPGNYPSTSNEDQDNIYIRANSHHVTLSYCAFRYPSRVHVFLFATVNDVTVEYCYLYWCRAYDDTGGAQHAQSFDGDNNARVIIRHNLFHDNTGTFIIGVLSRGAASTPSDDWEIYGNVFYDDGGRSRYAASDSPICVINDREANGWKIYNNTFMGLTPNGANGNVGIDFSQGTTTSGGNQVYNNLWYDHRSQNDEANITFEPGDATSVHDYSYWNSITTYPSETNDQIGTGSIIAGHTSLNFALSEATQAGKDDLGSPYNVDMLGNTRGSDGTWDRGAIEFNGGAVTQRGRFNGSGVIGKGKLQ